MDANILTNRNAIRELQIKLERMMFHHQRLSKEVTELRQKVNKEERLRQFRDKKEGKEDYPF